MPVLRIFVTCLAGLTLAAVLTMVSLSDTARAQPAGGKLRLLMIEREGCVYCAQWRAEIGPAYPSSPEGRRAPVEFIDIDGPWPDGLALESRPYLTPTFVLIRDGIELSRLQGYPGATQFWPLLGDMLRDAGVSPPDRDGTGG